MLPEAVEKQVKLADELHRQVYGNPSQDAAGVEQKQAEAQPGEGDEQRQQQAEQPEQLQEQSHESGDASYWKSRFEVLEGKYRAEVPRYADQLRSQAREIDTLKQQLDNLTKAAPPNVADDELTKKYGDEFINDIRRLVPQHTDELKSKVENIERLTADQMRERFFQGLTEAAPEWRKLNNDDGFLTWLSGIDALSGQPRMMMFDDANERGDVGRVAAFFNSYGRQTQSTERQPNRNDLSKEVVPDTRRMTPNAPPTKKVWSETEIGRFYSDIRKGLIPKEEAANIERDIFAAQREGRIR